MLRGSTAVYCESSLQDEALASLKALEISCSKNIRLNQVLTDYANLVDIINNEDKLSSWRFKDIIHNIKNMLGHYPEAKLDHIPPTSNGFADALSNYASLNLDF